jgi:hypothetical protein
MKKTIGFLGGLTTFMTCFYVYLNLANEKSYTFEDTLKILRINFQNEPFKLILYVLIFILFSIVISYILNKLIKFFDLKEEERKFRVKNSLEYQKHIQNKRDEVFERMFNSEIDYKKTINKPWLKIKGEHHTLILRDICDKCFPESGQWFKAEVFDLHKDGIEFYDVSTAIGFDVFFDKYKNWDTKFWNERIRKGNFIRNTTENVCTFFIPFDKILEIDWEHDDYIGCATVFCEFKQKLNKHKVPYSKVRYYVANEYESLNILDDRKHKIFKPLWWRIINFVYIRPFRRLKHWIGDIKIKRNEKKYYR